MNFFEEDGLDRSLKSEKKFYKEKYILLYKYENNFYSFRLSKNKSVELQP
jgi:hypothetical protein